MTHIRKDHLKILLLTTLLAVNTSATAQALHEHHEHDQHEAQAVHEHGVAHMQFVVAEQEVLLEVSSPLYNVIGFESEPSTPEQLDVFEKQLAAIEKGDLIRFNPQAQCRLKNQTIRNPFPKMKAHDHAVSEHDGHEHKHGEHGHTDLSFEYELHCQSADELKELNSQNLFKAWPNLQTLRVEWIFQNQQSADTLDRDHTVLHFK